MDCRDCIYYEKRICKLFDYEENICHYVEEVIKPEIIENGKCDFYISMEEWLND